MRRDGMGKCRAAVSRLMRVRLVEFNVDGGSLLCRVLRDRAKGGEEKARSDDNVGQSWGTS